MRTESRLFPAGLLWLCMAGLGGCATTEELEALRAEVARANAAASRAASDAARARRDAAAARSEVRSANEPDRQSEPESEEPARTRAYKWGSGSSGGSPPAEPAGAPSP